MPDGTITSTEAGEYGDGTDNVVITPLSGIIEDGDHIFTDEEPDLGLE
jgi:hypothetical protein